MSRIFISHARGDTEIATRLTKHLGQAGYEVLSPADEPILGSPVSEVINECIRKSDVVILIISDTSQQSSTLHHELGYAIGSGAAILPVRIHEVDLPDDLTQTVFIDAVGRTQEQVTAQIQEAVARILAQRSRSRARRAEIQTRVEDSAATYIQNSLTELTATERGYRHIGYVLYSVCFVIIIFAVISLGINFWGTTISTPDWRILILHIFRLTVYLAFIVVAAKLAFTLAKSFMVESLRNADRIHAIKFGQFYLKAFGEQAEWSQVKDAFQHWNIDSGSDFIRQDVKQIDPELHRKFIELMKAIRK